MKNLFFIMQILLLIGCASKPENIKTQYISPLTYKDYDCEQIAMEQDRISRELGVLYNSLKTTAERDNLQLATSLVFWPMLFTLEYGDGPEAIEYGRLKGELKALEIVSVKKKCNLNFDKFKDINYTTSK